MLAYWERQSGSRSENIEQVYGAHPAGEAVLYLGLGARRHRAFLQFRLAEADLERSEGDPADNIEKAIYNIDLALKVYDQRSYPKEWAATQLSSGGQPEICTRGDRGENIDKAISFYMHVLTVFNRQDFPIEWANTQKYLGLLDEMPRAVMPPLISSRAIEHFQLALQVFTRQAYPDAWAYLMGISPRRLQ